MGGMREAQSSGYGGHLQGASFDPAVASFTGFVGDRDVTPGQGRELGLQAGLVAFDGQDVVGAALVHQVFGVGSANVRNGWSQFTLDHDRVAPRALVVRLTAKCNTTGAIQRSSDQPGARRYERPQSGPSGPEPPGTPCSPVAASPPSSAR